MGGYNSRFFSKEFSQRTEDNLEYILRAVNQNEEEKKFKEEFIGKYQSALNEVDELVKSIRDDAKSVSIVQKKGKNELISHLYSVSNKIDSGKKELEKSLSRLVSTDQMSNKKIYEITQLLNSLMGVAVLPYEMHKEFFKRLNDDKKSEENKGKLLEDIQYTVKNSPEYDDLLTYIMKLYSDKKWNSKYESDLNNGSIRTDKIVFNFLGHLRNATCHSGDNSLCILPLDDGVVITEVLFYDTNPKNKQEEFAMRLTVDELKDLVKAVSEFYRYSPIGEIDKTVQIIKAEERVNKLLEERN